MQEKVKVIKEQPKDEFEDLFIPKEDMMPYIFAREWCMGQDELDRLEEDEII